MKNSRSSRVIVEGIDQRRSSKGCRTWKGNKVSIGYAFNQIKAVDEARASRSSKPRREGHTIC